MSIKSTLCYIINADIAISCFLPVVIVLHLSFFQYFSFKTKETKYCNIIIISLEECE